MKMDEQHNLREEEIGEVLPKNTVLYTTMEPCNKRLSGNLTFVERILRLGDAIEIVYVEVKEPETPPPQTRKVEIGKCWNQNLMGWRKGSWRWQKPDIPRSTDICHSTMIRTRVKCSNFKSILLWITKEPSSCTFLRIAFRFT